MAWRNLLHQLVVANLADTARVLESACRRHVFASAGRPRVSSVVPGAVVDDAGAFCREWALEAHRHRQPLLLARVVRIR